MPGIGLTTKGAGLAAPAGRLPTSNSLSATLDVWTSGVAGAGTASAVSGVVCFTPLDVANALTVTALAVEVTTAGAGGAPTVRMGVYGSDAQGWPGALLIDVGSIDASSTGVKAITGLTLALQPGRYWLAAVAQGATVSQPATRVSTGGGLSVPTDTAATALAGAPGLRTSSTVTTGLANPASSGAGLFQGYATPIRVAARTANST